MLFGRMNRLNILILSCGTRNKVVEYFKRELSGDGRVIATDCSELAPALYEADKYYLVPSIKEKGYVDRILEICEEEKVDVLFSLIDPELEILSKSKKHFLKKGIIPVVSDSNVIQTCFDKYKMFEFCSSNEIPTVFTYGCLSYFLEEYAEKKIDFPVFVKPRCGSCSTDAQIVSSLEKLKLLCEQDSELIIQEYVNGTEFGADVYVDLLSGEIVSIFTKQKLRMRAGETDKSVSVKNEELFDLIEVFVKKLGAVGYIDIDIFKTEKGYLISEVNPRFGGGYPHAYECGVNFPKYLINNVKGIENKRNIGAYEEGVFMMKYLDIKIISDMRILK